MMIPQRQKPDGKGGQLTSILALRSRACALPSLTVGLLTRVSLFYCGRMNAPPPRPDFTAKEWRLIQDLNTPAKVQRWLTAMPYNWERKGGTMRSFREVVKRNEAHC